MSYIENENEVVQETNNQQKWYKSPVVQIAVITNILYILKSFGLLENVGITEDSYKEIVTGLTTLINIIAYANNPKNKKGW